MCCLVSIPFYSLFFCGFKDENRREKPALSLKNTVAIYAMISMSQGLTNCVRRYDDDNYGDEEIVLCCLRDRLDMLSSTLVNGALWGMSMKFIF